MNEEVVGDSAREDQGRPICHFKELHPADNREHLKVIGGLLKLEAANNKDMSAGIH